MLHGWFNAWKHADEDELLVALARVIVQAMTEDDAVSKVLAKLLDSTYSRRNVVNTLLSWFDIKIPSGRREIEQRRASRNAFRRRDRPAGFVQRSV